MIAAREPTRSGVGAYRTKLLVSMMLVVVTTTGLVLFWAQRNAANAAEEELQRRFQAELAALHDVQELRHAALVERCRALVRRPRIHAALEDNALDLLYPSATDELRDLMGPALDRATALAEPALHAEFYRFLDRNGALIAPPSARETGDLSPQEESRLALPTAPDRQQLGYLVRRDADGRERLAEIIAMPIVSSETGEVIAALVLGFKPPWLPGPDAEAGIRRGIWLGGALRMDEVSAREQSELTAALAEAMNAGGDGSSFRREVDGQPHLLFFKRINPGSLYPAAYEVCVYPLAELQARQRRLRWQVLAAGGGLLLLGFGVSHVLSRRLSRPVEKLAVASAEHQALRARAEAALEATSEELQRAARFSADASHQLKTPVTVLRAGLEDLLAHEQLTPEQCREISALIHQTYRLSGVIEDLLLLSRMDAGRLKIEFKPVHLTRLIEAALDDLTAHPDAPELATETDYPEDLEVAGEQRYIALILQNLLENARKYNLPGGRIRVVAREESGCAVVTIGNTGKPIPPEAQAHIFERFHRGTMGENVPGYGLGLNLARELARLHEGDVRLLRSDDGWTEFEVRFRALPGTALGRDSGR